MKLLKNIGDIIISIIIAVLIAVFVMKFIGMKAVVYGDSMNPTLFDGQNLIASKISYIIDNPERFDVVIVDGTDKEYEKILIKRVIALPGETVQIDSSGNIYINDVKLEENYGAEKINDPGIARDKITLKENEYFVMGDNRNHSLDSRSPVVGVISREQIEAKAIEIKLLGLDKERN